MQAELNTYRATSFDQLSFAGREDSHLQIVLLAQCLKHELSQLGHATQRLVALRHRVLKAP